MPFWLRAQSRHTGTSLASVFALAIMFMAWSPPADAQQRVLPRSNAEIRLSYAPVVKRAAPAVVNVYVTRRVREFRSPFSGDPFFDRFFGFGGAPRERMQNSLGSGVIVKQDGIVVTNYHVIKGGGEAEIRVALSDKREFNAKIILTDPKTDLAVLQIQANGERFPYLDFEDSDSLEVGDLVLAIGNPFGVGQTVTTGIVSAKARTRVGRSNEQFFIQTDAAINPGNSGGALVDMAGRLVGVNTAIFSRSGGSNGIGFAIPANLVRVVVNSALKTGKVVRPWFGARLKSIDSDLAASLDLARVSGALVEQVYRSGPARSAGIRPGDVITRVNGREVADQRAFNYRFTTLGTGGTAEVEVLRNGRLRKLQVALEPAPGGETKIQKLVGEHPFDGASVADITPALAEEIGLRDPEGVVVVQVERGTYASSIGLRPRDIIVSIGQATITDVEQLVGELQSPRRLWRLSVKRGGRVLSLAVRG